MAPQAAAAPQAPEVPEVVAAYVAALFDEAWELQEQYGNLLKKRSALRQQLVNERTMGHITREQQEEFDELFPARSKLTPEEREKRLVADLEKVRKRREEAAKKAEKAKQDAEKAA